MFTAMLPMPPSMACAVLSSAKPIMCAGALVLCSVTTQTQDVTLEPVQKTRGQERYQASLSFSQIHFQA